MASFIEIFGDYIELVPGCDAARGEICGLRLDQARRALTVTLVLDELVPRGALSELGRKLEGALTLDTAAVCPRYPGGLFSSDYLPEIIARLGGEGVPVNGFFTGSRADLSGDTLRVYLQPRRRPLPRGDPLRPEDLRRHPRGVRTGGAGPLRRGARGRARQRHLP